MGREGGRKRVRRLAWRDPTHSRSRRRCRLCRAPLWVEPTLAAMAPTDARHGGKLVILPRVSGKPAKRTEDGQSPFPVGLAFWGTDVALAITCLSLSHFQAQEKTIPAELKLVLQGKSKSRESIAAEAEEKDQVAPSEMEARVLATEVRAWALRSHGQANSGMPVHVTAKGAE